MPNEPKKRHSKHRQGRRRAAIKLALPTILLCSNCGTPVAPHTACRACGYYKGKLAVAR